jgi:uncharacterized membrane protein
LVHFPIAFLSSSQILDTTYFLTTHARTAPLVASIYNIKPYLSDITRTSHLFLALGLLTAVPAIITGGYEITQLLSRQAVADKIAAADGAQGKKKVIQQTHPKVKMAFLHAIVMDIVVAGAAFNWWSRRSAPAGVPSDLNVLIAAVTGFFFMGAGSLGAQLVFNHGVGVHAAGALKKQQ